MAKIGEMTDFCPPKNRLCRLPSQLLTLSIDSGDYFRPGRAFSSLSTKVEIWTLETIAAALSADSLLKATSKVFHFELKSKDVNLVTFCGPLLGRGKQVTAEILQVT